jgi:hypothetical protein
VSGLLSAPTIAFCKFTNFCVLVFLDSLLCSFQLIEEERRGKSIGLLESSCKDGDEDASNNEEESGEHNSDSNSGSDVEESSECEETSPKVDITG